MEGGEPKAEVKVAAETKAMAKATDKVKGTAKDGGETSPTPTKVGGEAIAKETKATQENDKMEISPKKRARSGGYHQFATIVRSRDT